MSYTYTLNELSEIADKVLLDAPSKTLLFYGNMGVGKTTLIKELARKLGVLDTVSSPTYSIVNEFELKNDKLYHFDFYRLKHPEEALEIGIEEYLHAGHWNFIEWPQRVESLLPADKTKIELSLNKNGSRTLNIMPVN